MNEDLIDFVFWDLYLTFLNIHQTPGNLSEFPGKSTKIEFLVDQKRIFSRPKTFLVDQKPY
jgi:hypothetical protein